METHKTLTIRLPEEVLKEMRELAEEHTRSLNGEVLVALREYIKQHRQGRLAGLKPYSVVNEETAMQAGLDGYNTSKVSKERER